jgi:hypothetical protein
VLYTEEKYPDDRPTIAKWHRDSDCLGRSTQRILNTNDPFFSIPKPDDDGKIIYFVYLMYGLATRLAYNAVLSTMNFYKA